MDLSDQITFEPLSRSNWNDFIRLFGEKGACANCWCMYYSVVIANHRMFSNAITLDGLPLGRDNSSSNE
jgi:hypothetical protein